MIDGPLAGKAKPLPQPQHRFEPCDRSARRAESLESADLRHVLLHPEMVTLDTLLEMLGDIMNRIRMQVPIIDLRLDCRRKGVGAVRADLAGDNKGSSFSILRKNACRHRDRALR
jgi:hypothetical protein